MKRTPDYRKFTWTHIICGECWKEQYPTRTPVKVRNSPLEKCCFCGSDTLEGIYIREAPESLKLKSCKGRHDKEIQGHVT